MPHAEISRKPCGNPTETRSKTITVLCSRPVLLGTRKAPSGAFTPANLKLTKSVCHTTFPVPHVPIHHHLRCLPLPPLRR